MEPNEKSNEEGLDERVVSGLQSFDENIYRSLLCYNEAMTKKRFLESYYTCDIYLDEFPDFRFTVLQCQHYFCTMCMKKFCNMHVKEGIVMDLICPDFSCKKSIHEAILGEVLDEEAFQRWKNLFFQKTLDSMPDVVYCLKCGTHAIDNSDHVVHPCNGCRFSFCTLCMDHWHPSQKCMTPEAKLQTLQAWQ